MFHYFLVRLLNTLIFLKSDVKSRFAGAGFEPRQTVAGLRLTAQPADLVRILLEEQKTGGNCSSNTIRFYFLVRLAGFEPAAYGLEVRCSIQLSYRRIL